MWMCNCIPDHIRQNFRCKKKSCFSCFGIKFRCSLEFTVLHFWLYMIFFGILIAFILKSLGCYLRRRCGGCHPKPNAPECTCSQNICPETQSSCDSPNPPSFKCNSCKNKVTNPQSNCSIVKNCASAESYALKALRAFW